MRPALILAILDREFESTREGHHTPVMLWGPPGVGKSQMVAQVAAAHGAPVIDIRLSQMEPSDLRGIPFRVNDLVEWAIPAMLPDEKRHGSSGILFLDEITSAAPTVSAAAYQLILDRKLGEYRVPDGWAIVAAGNRQGDRGVTFSMPAPLANRFTHYEVETHLDDWVAWAYGNGIDERVIAFLRFRPDQLFNFEPAKNGESAFPSPRTWEFAHRAVKKFENRPDALLPGLEACVGKAAGIEIKAFMDNLDNLPDIDAIVTGKPATMPKETDLQYAVAAALVGRAIRAKGTADERTVLGHILDYATKFPSREMGVMLVSDMQRAVGERMFTLPQFTQWAKQVADVMIFDLWQKPVARTG